jgi:hypothetical protein
VPADLSRTAVMTTAYRRPYYFEPVLKSWAAAEGMGDVSRFVIALDPSADRADGQRALIERMRPRFTCPVEVAAQSERAQRSPSAHRAIGEAADYCFEDPGLDFLVFGEEDILVSSDVLAYMAWARDRFAHDDLVLCVLAHNKGGQGWDPAEPAADADAGQETARLLPYFNPWVWGTWRDRWEKILEPQWDWEASTGEDPLQHGYDWNIQLRVMPDGGYLNVVPDASRSQNTGKFEGGYSRPELFGNTQSQSFRLRRGRGDYRLVASA